MKSRAIRLLYTYAFLDDFIFIYPLYQLMFVARGLSINQISWLFIIWSVAALATEVPTGLLADRYSRTKLLAIGQLIKTAGFLIWLIWPTFWGFALGFVLWGIGSSFDSGTFQALMYDELEALGQHENYVRLRGRSESWRLTGNLMGTAGASLIVGFGFNTVLTLSLFAPLAAALIAWNIPQAPRREEPSDTAEISTRQAISETFRKPAVLLIVLLGGFIGAMFGSLEEYTAIFFKTVGAPLTAIPILEAILVLATVLASVVAHRFEALSTRTFIYILALSGVCLAGSTSPGGAGAVGLMIAFFFVTKLLEVIYDGKLQHSITGKLRATITSVSGFAMEILSIGTYLVFGAVADTRGTMAAFTVFGITIIVVAAGYFAFGRRLFTDRAPSPAGRGARG